jgi:thiol-disulfide isomerase/thioredoxin
LLLEIYTLYEFIEFKGTRQFNIPEQYFRNESKWQILEDSLIRQYSFDNDKLLDIPIYTYFLQTYYIRVQERCWIHPELIKQYTDSNTTINDLLDDPQNLLRENIINSHFKGKSAEFLYADLFMMSINDKEENLPEIFNRFEQKYPKSQYIPYVQSAINKIMERRKRILSDKMILIDKTDSLQTMNDLLKMFKGQTVLLDMWGTWCGPCRSELSLNAELIRKRFDSTNLTFVYVANYDTNKKSKWKELIAYYNLVGTHILASENLTKSIMNSIKGTEYPTYLIIRKNGTYIVSEAGYPMNKDILYDELECALKID